MVNDIECIYMSVLNKMVSRLGFGCCPMGGHGWGITDEKELIEAVATAMDYGINFFDTADVYGIGVSEKVLGRALRGKRDKAVIATKFGVRREYDKFFYDNSLNWIEKAITFSLSRLQTDYIDLYQIHYWDKKTPIEEVCNYLGDLQKQGKILAFGVTNIDLIDKGFVQPIDKLATFSFEYSLANRIHESQINSMHEKLGPCFLSWGSLGQGILSGKYNQNSKFAENDRRRRKIYCNFHGEKLEQNLRIVNYIQSILPYYKNKTIVQIAIRWILDYIPFSIALTGIKRKEQLIENIGALNWKLNKEHIVKLCELSDPTGAISKNES
jgi:aryl-alcohol dehydrogenase-like predicted oxidoreductase